MASQQTRLVKGAMDIIKEAEEVAGFNRVERLADVVVGGDAPELEQGAPVVASAGLLHVLLETQERGALGEEDRESRQGDVSHGVRDVIAGAPIGEFRSHGSPAFDEVIEGARVHGNKECRYRTKSTSYDRVTKVTKR